MYPQREPVLELARNPFGATERAAALAAIIVRHSDDEAKPRPLGEAARRPPSLS